MANNERREDGKTPLFYAADNRDLPVIKKLLKSKADIHISDSGGQTVLARAVRSVARLKHVTNSDLETVRVLLEHGADPNKAIPWEYFFPSHSLCAAVDCHKPDLVRLLLDYGADPCIRDQRTGNNIQPWYAKPGVSRMNKDIYDILQKAQESCTLHSNKQNTTSGL